jgi:hypothetical protein
VFLFFFLSVASRLHSPVAWACRCRHRPFRHDRAVDDINITSIGFPVTLSASRRVVWADGWGRRLPAAATSLAGLS